MNSQLSVCHSEANAKPWLKYVFRLLSGLSVVALTSILIFNNRQTIQEPDAVVVHANITTVQLPPPPPPMEVVEQVQSAPKLDVRIAGDGPSLKLSKINMQATKPILSVQKKALSTPDFSKESVEFDTASFGLSDLDSLPRQLTPLQITIPSELKRKGVTKVLVKLHVQIDTYGRVLLKGIKENPYPELNKALVAVVRSAKFTPPKRHGKLVKAEFIWPLELKE